MAKEARCTLPAAGLFTPAVALKSARHACSCSTNDGHKSVQKALISVGLVYHLTSKSFFAHFAVSFANKNDTPYIQQPEVLNMDPDPMDELYGDPEDVILDYTAEGKQFQNEARLSVVTASTSGPRSGKSVHGNCVIS